MSDLTLEKDGSTLVLNRVAWNNPKVFTLYNIVSGDLVVRGDATGNPIRLDFTCMDQSGPTKEDFIDFAETYKGIIITCQFEGYQHFGYIESYNVSDMYTRSVTREELNDLLELVVSTEDETDGEISFSFRSLNKLEVPETDVGYRGLYLQ